jgi:hypothetical protein
LLQLAVEECLLETGALCGDCSEGEGGGSLLIGGRGGWSLLVRGCVCV